MSKTSLRQKILLCIFGLFLTLILLEIGLRTAGAVVLFLQDRHNHVTDSNDYRILCLGESTTALGGADSYPSQLEEMLNAQSRKNKYIVINKGIISTTTDHILAHVEQNLDQYHPQMVILMMGINDNYLPRPTKIPLWLWKAKNYFQEFRVYKLANLLYKHISHRIQETTLVTENKDEDLELKNYSQKEDFMKNLIALETQSMQVHLAKAKMYELNHQEQAAKSERNSAHESSFILGAAYADLAHRYLKEGSLDQAQDCLQKASAFIPENPDLNEYWGEFFLAVHKPQEAILAFKKTIMIDVNHQNAMVGLARALYQIDSEEAFVYYASYLKLKPNDYWGYVELAGWLKEKKHYEQALEYLHKAISIDSVTERAYLDIAHIYEALGKFKDEEEFYLKLEKENPKRPVFAQVLAQFYKKQGRQDLAKTYSKKANRISVGQYSAWTISNYEEILNKILDRKIKVIVMQYPVRSIEPLKNVFGSYKDILFVENKQNFKQALQTGRFSELFSDSFASDFGHCTRLGNQLIAKNLTKVILDTVK